MIFQRSG